MLPTQQPGVSVSSAPALSPNKSIKQRQRQRTLNEQLDLLDRQFCVEVDVQMANRMDSISVSTPTSKDFVSTSKKVLIKCFLNRLMVFFSLMIFHNHHTARRPRLLVFKISFVIIRLIQLLNIRLYIRAIMEASTLLLIFPLQHVLQ
uniref:Uncharacterized protein n=1 Tax=Meloidogyne incognita TaxID=6306 RepID=A0A914LCF6_MELIC